MAQNTGIIFGVLHEKSWLVILTMAENARSCEADSITVSEDVVAVDKSVALEVL